MDIFDNEVEIIELFQSVKTSSVALIPEDSPQCESLFMSIKDRSQWKNWHNTSGKADPPPDFYSDKYGFMMDIMRVDDHGRKSKKGKLVNPTRRRETEITRELEDAGIFKVFPNAKPLLIVDTKLPTHEDHNYVFYRDEFIRVLESHKNKIPNYKINHPALKTVFFVFDESSQYMQMNEKNISIAEGAVVKAMPHLWFADADFLKVFVGTDIDYIIWFAPYKLCEMFDNTGTAVKLPEVVIIDTNNVTINAIKYTTHLMESVEV